MEENGSPFSEIRATYLQDHHFRVEADGVSKEVDLAIYIKVNMFLYLHHLLRVYGLNIGTSVGILY